MKLVHLFSSDLSLPGARPYIAPALERGWDVTVMCPDGPLVDQICGNQDGIRWSPLGFTRSMDPLSDVRASHHLLDFLARGQFDIVHTHNVKVGLAGRVLGRLARAPVVVHTMHGSTWSLETPFVRRALHALLERTSSLCADMLLAQSRCDYDSFVKMGVVPVHKIRVIGNGVDLSRFDPVTVPAEVRERERAALGVHPNETLVVFAGRIVREKGVEEIYQASEGLLAQGIRVAMVGRDDVARGDSPSEAARAAAERGHVLRLGERHDMPNVYAASDIVGLASWREGLPRVLIEGAAMGKPLAASDVRGCREVVRAGETGLLFEVKNPSSLTHTLVELARNPVMRAQFGASARRNALEAFDLNKVVGRVYQAYDDLCQAKQPIAGSRGNAGRLDRPRADW